MARASRSERDGLRSLVRGALAEDRARRDRTTAALRLGSLKAEGTVTAQASGVVSGLKAVRAIAAVAHLGLRVPLRDGSRVRRGSRVVVLRGDARTILAVERTVLNFLMHASGVATATDRARRAAGSAGGAPQVWATRKTLPGLRDLEKAAVVHGGGRPHRRDLEDGLLVKSNHLKFVRLEEAVRRARRARRPHERVQVEVRSASEAVRAARAGADALLLDNMSPAAARRALRALERTGLRRGRWVELSGGIAPTTVRRYRSVGADAVSLGALTHSAPALPFHLTVRPVALRRRAR
jgi:nicotinate-nucleotide pyrophosphorylase (carboxylating)